MKCVASPVISLPCSYSLSIDPKLDATISPIPASPRWIAESATSASCASTSPSTVIASSLWSAARICPSWKIDINCRSRLLSFTICTYDSIAGFPGNSLSQEEKIRRATLNPARACANSARTVVRSIPCPSPAGPPPSGRSAGASPARKILRLQLRRRVRNRHAVQQHRTQNRNFGVDR